MECEFPECFTDAEVVAIRSLSRLAKRWPRSLKLFSAAGSLHVIKTADDDPDSRLSYSRSVPISGIPNDGGDPDWRP